MKAKYYRIFVQMLDGTVIEAFNWIFDPAWGITLALREAKNFGHNPDNAWAEEM